MGSKILIIVSFLFNFMLAEASIRVFYIPIATETYTPVTTENIEQQAHYIFTTNDKDLISLVSNIERNTSSETSKTIEAQGLRLKIVDSRSKQVLFLNNLYKMYNNKNMFSKNESAHRIVNVIDKIVQSRCLKIKKAKFSKPSNCSK